MLNFTQGLAVFALAGLGAAAAPVIIHLLNRQRFRTLQWAPMQFLKQAMVRSRKMVELRDVLLMLVRTAAVVLFGFALARPFLGSGYGTMSAMAMLGGFAGLMSLAGAAVLAKPKPRRVALIAGAVLLAIASLVFLADHMTRRSRAAQGQTARQSAHVILLIDNSMSMAYRPGDDTLLDEAKARAKSFVEHMPPGSRVTVIPLCGSPGGLVLDPYPSTADALEAIEDIRVVDRSASAREAASLAIEAGRRLPEMDKRVVFLSDQQRVNWPVEAGPLWRQLPDLQIVAIGEEVERENAWVEVLELQDRVADKDVPAVINAVIRCEGPAKTNNEPAAKNVQVTLKVAGEPVETRPLDLLPGQKLLVTFEHRFECDAGPGRPVFVPISVTINPPDRLPQDNTRHLAVPVVASLPVLFVDQFGEHEDPNIGTYGETAHLRSLLAPKLSKEQAGPKLIEVRHMTIDRLATRGRSALADVRLVVMAGVADPSPVVAPLREYVAQGGQLLVAAGGNFEPAPWNLTAWADGAGILPARLADDPVGETLSETDDAAKYFRLDFKSLMGDYFHLPGEPPEKLRDLYGRAVFFKAVVPLAGPKQQEKLVAAEAERIARKLKFLIESDRRRRLWARQEREGPLSDEEKVARAQDKQKRSEIHPHWLQWNQERINDPLDRRPDKGQTHEQLARRLAEGTRPQVLARFTNGHPYLIERPVGLGSIIFLASGTYGNWKTGWNTLSLADSVILYDRILRSMLERTLPQRNQTIGNELVVPIDAADRRDRFVMKRPDGVSQDIAVEVLAGDVYGLVLRNVTERGLYTIERVARREDEAKKRPFVRQVAFNGPAAESEIDAIDEEEMKKRMGENAVFKWIGKGQQISLHGARRHGEHLWSWLIWTVLLLFLAERVIAAWPRLAAFARREAPG